MLTLINGELNMYNKDTMTETEKQEILDSFLSSYNRARNCFMLVMPISISINDLNPTHGKLMMDKLVNTKLSVQDRSVLLGIINAWIRFSAEIKGGLHLKKAEPLGFNTKCMFEGVDRLKLMKTFIEVDPAHAHIVKEVSEISYKEYVSA